MRCSSVHSTQVRQLVLLSRGDELGAFPPSSSPRDNMTNCRTCVLWTEEQRIQDVWQALDDAAGEQARMVQSEAVKYEDFELAALDTSFGKLKEFADSSIAVVGASADPT